MLFFRTDNWWDKKIRDYIKKDLQRVTGEKCVLLPPGLSLEPINVPVKNDAAPAGEAAPQGHME